LFFNAMTEDGQSIEELEKQVEEYQAQLKTVNAALQDEPDLEELLTVKQNLIDVLKSTKDLLQLKREQSRVKYTNIQEIAAERGLFMGMQCEAKWKEDGVWYKAILNNMTENGFGVSFTEYGNTDVLPPDCVRPRKKLEVVVLDDNEDAAKAKEAAIAVNNKGELVIPTSLKIHPTDTESVRKTKKKRIKALKSTYRMQKLEGERNKRKATWQDFQKHGKTKRARKSSSIFQSPDSVTGKVGVTGSGKGMTDFKAQKYEPKKLASALPVGVQIVKKDSEEETASWL